MLKPRGRRSKDQEDGGVAVIVDCSFEEKMTERVRFGFAQLDFGLTCIQGISQHDISDIPMLFN